MDNSNVLLFGSLSVLTTLHQHNLQSRLCFKAGMQSSRDLVGSERRQLVQREVSKADPFLLSRPKSKFSIKSRGSPFAAVSSQQMSKFVSAAKDRFALHFPDLFPAAAHPNGLY